MFCTLALPSCYTFYWVKSVPIRSYSGPYSVRIGENTDQNNFEYGHFSRTVSCNIFFVSHILLLFRQNINSQSVAKWLCRNSHGFLFFSLTFRVLIFNNNFYQVMPFQHKVSTINCYSTCSPREILLYEKLAGGCILSLFYLRI